MSFEKEPSIATFTGRQYHFLLPRPEEIDILDIAVSCSRESRYAGHSREYYSVAQHCLYVAELVEYLFKYSGLRVGDSPKNESLVMYETVLYFLLHDASEGYLRDMPGPIKKYLKDYQTLERVNQSAIYSKFNVSHLALTTYVVPYYNYTYSYILEPWFAPINTPISLEKLLKFCDITIRSCEIRDIINDNASWTEVYPPIGTIKIQPLTSDAACIRYLNKFESISRSIEKCQSTQ